MTLYKACIPPVRQFGTGGRVAQLRRLRGNRHPVTDAPLPPPVDLEGNPITSQFGYARLGRRDIGEKDSEFKAYIPEDLLVPQPAIAIGGKSAAEKLKVRLTKVRLRESCEMRRVKAIRKQQREHEADDLIRTFVHGDVGCGGDQAGGAQTGSVPLECQVCEPNVDDSCEQFWNDVISDIEGVGHPLPWQRTSVQVRPTRGQRLGGGSKSAA